MADEAFALSPISASAAPLGEADFDAIRDAFMETSRGRWFLAEYARRNRSADTAMVLDAVARIEQTIETQQQATPADALPKALAAIRRSLVAARTAATAAFDKRIMNDADALAPIQKGVRIIREISWRWREIGGDSRICDILDSQVGAIENVHAELVARNDTTALHAAFGLIETTLDELWAPPVAAATASPSPTKTTSSPSATGEKAIVSPEETVSPEQVVVVEPEAAITTVPDLPGNAADETMATNHSRGTPAAGVSEQDMADDDAVLDIIALEMGAPDLEEPETDHATIGRPEEPAPTHEPIADSSSAHPDREPESVPEIAAPPSLGVSLLANGIVPRTTPRSDPMAPFRRMTQAEKIAFFS